MWLLCAAGTWNSIPKDEPENNIGLQKKRGNN